MSAVDEARGKQLLEGPAAEVAWPLGGVVTGRQRFSKEHLPLDQSLASRREWLIFEAHDFQFDKLSELVDSHVEEHESYAAEFRVMSDHGIPSDVLEATQHNHYPQFILRNIGRVEKTDCDPDEPLPMERKDGVSGSAADDLFEEVRTAEVPKVEFAEVWSQRFNYVVRSSLRRLLMEDPWEHRFGAEAKANYDGPVYQFVVEGTHPDDLPDAWWGPETIRGPERRIVPRGREGEEKATSIFDVIRAVSAGEG